MSDITKLKECGLNTIGQILQSSKRYLITIKGLSEAKVDKIVDGKIIFNFSYV